MGWPTGPEAGVSQAQEGALPLRDFDRGVSREHICGSRVGGAQERTLWPSQISVCPQMYNFTSFTVSLNELQTGMEKILAPTDCRLRPDIRSMENGNMGV